MRGLLLAVLLTIAASAQMSAEAAEGMPQLDFGNPLTLSQVVWLAIIFVVLYLLLSRWALPQVGAVLEMRAATIARDLDAARTAKSGADEAVAELTTATRDAQGRAQNEVATAVATAREQAATQAAEMSAVLDRQIAESEQRIGAARAAAMGALRQVAADTAGALVQRLIGRPADPQHLDRAVAATMADTLAARG